MVINVYVMQSAQACLFVLLYLAVECKKSDLLSTAEIQSVKTETGFYILRIKYFLRFCAHKSHIVLKNEYICLTLFLSAKRIHHFHQT